MWEETMKINMKIMSQCKTLSKNLIYSLFVILMLCTVYLVEFWSGPGDLCCLCNPIEFPLEFSGMRLMRGSLWCHRPRYMLMWLASLTSLSVLSYMLFSFSLASLFSFYTTFNSKFLKTVISFVVSLFSLLRFPFLASSLFSLNTHF